jgi:protein ImuB
LPSPTIPPQSDEHWDRRPIALTDEGKSPKLRLVTAAATQRRVEVGMSAAAARARCAELTLLRWDAAKIGREVARASAAFLAASPQVTPVREAPGTWWIGAGGWRGSGEGTLARTLLALARAWHPRARVAVADSCVAAQAATWSAHAANTPLHLAPGSDADYLVRVPIALIPMDAELREGLVALGLRTAGAFAALDPLDVERRWGSEGLASWRLAHGTDDRRAALARTEDPRAVMHELATSADSMEPVLFIVRAALDRLVGDLVAEGLAAAEVAITLTLDDRTSALPHTGARSPTIRRAVRPARPLARVAPLFERCRALLDDWPERVHGGAPVRAVEVRIAEVVPSSAEQRDMLATSWRDPAAVDAALERLRAKLGPDSVVRSVRRDSHAPERAGSWNAVDRLVPERQAAAGSAASAPGAAPVPAAVRLLDQPEEILVTLDARRAPRALAWRGRRFPIARADGPERLSGEWWHAAPFAREYWRCESADDGRTFLVFRDAVGWRLQGWND